MRTFNPKASREERALQAWLVLIRHARERRTITYKMLSEEMFRKRAQGVLAQILGCIAFYCQQHNLPPLTCIVVGQGRGTPGHQIPESGDDRRENVYKFDWYNLFPPSPAELDDAFQQA